MLSILLLACMVALALGVILVDGVAAAGRRRRFDRFAKQFALDYWPTDPFGLIDHTFDLFNLADRARCENVISGEWQGVPVKMGDLWFAGPPTRTGPLPGEGALLGIMVSELRQLVQRRLRFSFAEVDLPSPVRHVAIVRRGAVGEAIATLLTGGLRFESERFNHTFDVRSDDAPYAFRFVDVGLMAWLLNSRSEFQGFEANGRRLLVYGRMRSPMALLPLLATAKEFRDHIPTSCFVSTHPGAR